MEISKICENAKNAKYTVAALSTEEKNRGLLAVARALEAHQDEIIEANDNDMATGREKGLGKGLLDRLALSSTRIHQMSEGIRQVASLDDPIGYTTDMRKRPNGLLIGKRTVPLGVVGVIYEARPNVTADVFALCFKTGNVVILKGGSDAIESNKAIVRVIKDALLGENLPENAITLIEDTSRETTNEMMKMNEYIDVLIPRGGAGLIRSVVENATVPVIETGTGNCHVFVDESADFDMAINVINNAKTQRISVCNACESIVVHEKIVDEFLPKLYEKLSEHHVEMRGDDKCCAAVKEAVPATEEDWSKEYLDYIISVKTVSSVDEAIAHINANNTGHSESIITENYANAQKFLDGIDAACVYVNASTRFTDGFEFGFGAEIGISTQKLHARGPMGLNELCSYKYVIYGSGQIRE